MAIPTPGFTSAQVATEAGISVPWNSNNASVLALLADGALPYNSADLAGRSGTDYIPAAVDWDDLLGDDYVTGTITVTNSNDTISSINPSISLRANVPSMSVNCTGSGASVTGILSVYVNNTFRTSCTLNKTSPGIVTAARSCDFTVNNGDTVYFEAELSASAFGSVSAGFDGTVSILNLSSGNTVLDTFLIGLTTSYDPVP
jgi:hypothetical protein